MPLSESIRRLVSRRAAALAALAALCALDAPRAAAAEPAKRILVLHSYHAGLEWTDAQHKGILEVLGAAVPAPEIHVEYLDWKYHPSPADLALLARLHGRRYTAHRPDLLLATDDAALAYALDHHATIFGGLPLVFCGVNEGNVKARLLAARARGVPVTGVYEVKDMAGNVELARLLDPGLRDVHVVHDTTESGLASRDAVRALEAAYAGRLRFHYLGERPTAVLRDEVSRLGPGSAVLLTTYYTGVDGDAWTLDASTRLFTEAARVPVYGINEIMLGHGIVGGSLLSGAVQGRLAARLALRILAGERAAGLPVVEGKNTRLACDWRALERHDLPAGRLPADAELVFRPPALHRDDPRLFWSLVGAIGLLVGVALFVVINTVRRLRAERARAASEERFARVYQMIPDGVLIASLPDGRLVDVNAGFTDILGYTLDDLRGKNPLESGVWVDPTESRRLQRVIIETGSLDGAECLLRGKSGRVLVCLISARVIAFDAQHRLLAVIRDVTEGKLAEQALRESEERFRAVYDGVNDAIFVHDAATGAILDVNRRVTELYGYGPDEIRGLTVADLTAIDDPRFSLEAGLERIGRAVSGPPQLFEWLARARDGRTFWVEVAARLARIDGRERVLAVVRDIDKRKAADRVLREYRAQLRAVFDTDAVAIGVTDPRGFFLQVNQRAAGLFGLPVRELVGRNAEEFVHPDDRAALFPVIADLEAGTREVARLERRYRRADGSEFWGEFSLTAIRDEEGRIGGGVGFIEDISERRAADEALRRSLAEKDVLLKEIHHRVKNNLQVISSLLRLQSNALAAAAREGRPGPDPLELFRESQYRVHTMALIHEKLYQTGDLARIDLADYVRALVGTLATSYAVDAPIAIDYDLDQVFVEIGDAIPCGLLVNELVSNALKHAFRGRSAGRLAIVLRAAGETVSLAVRDDGPGLPAGLDWRTASTLGLQLVLSLAAQLDGHLEHERPPAGGTAFTAVFPRRGA